MADNQWLLKEDGYLNVNTEATNIVYHSNLYVVLVFTRNNEVKVLDINSGVVLHSCRLAAGNKNFPQIQCDTINVVRLNRMFHCDSLCNGKFYEICPAACTIVHGHGLTRIRFGVRWRMI